ncbi:hypothetical protein AAG570_002023, partial [Ranatra chinensis]
SFARKHDHENFLCTLLLAGSARDAALAVRAFNIEVARVADVTSELNTARGRMTFWEHAVDDIFRGSVPHHPVTLELARTLKDYTLTKRNLQRLVKARHDHLNTTGFETLGKMEEYAEETVSPIYYVILEAMGLKNVQCDHAASHLGKSQGLATLMRAVPHNTATRRQLLLPHDLLLKHSVVQESVLRGTTTKGLKDVLFEIASAAKLHLDKTRSLVNNVPKEARTVFLPAVAVDCFLEQLRHVDFDIFDPKLRERNRSLGWKLFWNKLRSRY